MEVDRWRPWPGQIFFAQIFHRFLRRIRDVIRRDDFFGFSLWITLKVLSWIFWVGPLLFFAASISLLLGIIFLPLLGAFYLLSIILYPFSFRPRSFFTRMLSSLSSRGEDILALASEIILLPDNYLEEI